MPAQNKFLPTPLFVQSLECKRTDISVQFSSVQFISVTLSRLTVDLVSEPVVVGFSFDRVLYDLRHVIDEDETVLLSDQKLGHDDRALRKHRG